MMDGTFSRCRRDQGDRVVGRTQRALTSLVAAIPAGFLAYSLVMVFLDRADRLTTIMQVMVGLTLACAALVTLMPFGLLIFSGKKATPAGDGNVAASRAAAIVDDDDVEAAEGVEMADDADVEEIDEEASDAFDIDDSDADVMADSDDEISGPASSMDELDSVDFDDDEDDEPAPKKRKK